MLLENAKTYDTKRYKSRLDKSWFGYGQSNEGSSGLKLKKIKANLLGRKSLFNNQLLLFTPWRTNVPVCLSFDVQRLHMYVVDH